jgi:phosphohistidine phosphatase
MDLVLTDYRVWPRGIIEDELYAASAEKLIERLRQLDEADRNVLLIGHNPGLYELAIILAEADSRDARELASGKLPTAARASFEIPHRWSALGGSRYELIAYVTVDSLHGDRG